MSTPPALPTFHTQQSPPPLRWRSWPLRDAPVRALLVLGGLLVAGLAVGWFSGRVSLSLLAVAALAASLWRFFLPVVFELGGDGVDQWVFRRQRHIPWQAVRRYEICLAGVLLLPHEDLSAMAPFRGLYLPWTTHHDEVLAQVRHYVDRSNEA